jgi:hydroxypyruvate isomerase
MPAAEQFAANLAMMFSDSPFLARFDRAGKTDNRPSAF